MFFKKKEKTVKNTKGKTDKPKRKMLTISRVDRDIPPIVKAGAEARGLKEWAYENELLWMAITIEMALLPELQKLLPVDKDQDANPNLADALDRLGWLLELLKLVTEIIKQVWPEFGEQQVSKYHPI